MEALALSASVFSVVSLFIQLAEKVQQLHDFWISFQNASSEIRNVALDLQTFCEVLDEGARSHGDNDPGMFKILTRCDSKVEDLKRIIERLEPDFASKRSIRRKWSSFKATLRKNHLAHFQRSLADTKLDLILIHQALAEKSSRRRFVALNNSVTDIGSQNSSICTKLLSIDSRTTDANQHITDVRKELQQMVECIQERTNLHASAFLAAELEQVFRNAIQDTMQSHDRSDIKQEIALGARQVKKARSIRTRLPYTWTPDLGPDKDHGAGYVEYTDNDEDQRPQAEAKRDKVPSSRTRKIAQCTSTEYKTIFGTISWQSRVIKITHQDGFLGHTENQELQTYVAIRPALWLIARRLDVQISRTFGGWTWRGRQFPLVAADSLIFKYCKEGNLAGVRDLFQHKLASPFDVDTYGLTPLHYAARRSNPSMCKLLIQAGAIVDAPSNLLRSPLFMVADGFTQLSEYELIETYRALVMYGQADTSWLDIRGRDIFLEVGWNRSQVKGLYWLLQHEETYFDPDHRNYNETPIMALLDFAGSQNDPIPMLNLLIDKGVDVDAQKAGSDGNLDAGYTALHFIMRYICARSWTFFNCNHSRDPYCGTVAHLLRRGAHPHLADRHGYTPTAMALAGGTHPFSFWQRTVWAHKDMQEFVRLELSQKHPCSLRDSGWDEVTLSDILSCQIVPCSYGLLRSHDECDYLGEWSVSTADHNNEPWWFDLQELVKAKKKPLPPLPRGWKKIRSDDGSFQYVEINTDLTTRERPKAAFFANLRTKYARRMYRKGIIRIETEGCETELDDWCSDDKGAYAEDIGKYWCGLVDESEGTSSDENEGSSSASDRDEHDPRETKYDNTARPASECMISKRKKSWRERRRR